MRKEGQGPKLEAQGVWMWRPLTGQQRGWGCWQQQRLFPLHPLSACCQMFRSDANVREVHSAGSRPWPAGASAAVWGGVAGGGGPAIDLLGLPPLLVALWAGPPGGGGRPGTSGDFSSLRAGTCGGRVGAPGNLWTQTSLHTHMRRYRDTCTCNPHLCTRVHLGPAQSAHSCRTRLSSAGALLCLVSWVSPAPHLSQDCSQSSSGDPAGSSMNRTLAEPACPQGLG